MIKDETRQQLEVMIKSRLGVNKDYPYRINKIKPIIKEMEKDFFSKHEQLCNIYSGVPGCMEVLNDFQDYFMTYTNAFLKAEPIDQTKSLMTALTWAIENSTDTSYRNNLVEMYASITGDFDTYTPDYRFTLHAEKNWQKRKNNQ